jgi:hypothetical protein
MKPRQILLLLISIVGLTQIISCASLAGDMDTEALEETAVAHLTSVAYLNKTAIVIAQQTNSVLPTLPPTQTYAPTITKRPRTLIPTTPGPSPTITQTPTSTITPTATPIAQAFVNGDTNCRTGPSKSYNWVAMIPAGTKVNLIARSISGDYFVIENPFDDDFCWLWGFHLSLIGQTENLPKYANPPTPRPPAKPQNTSAPSFRIYESGLIQCDGGDALVIRVRNYTQDGFRSWRARVFKSPGYLHLGTYSATEFSHSPDECALTIGFLPYRDTGYAIIPIDTSLADRFLIEFEGCILDSKQGDCAFDGLYINTVDLIGTPTPTPTTTP